MVTNEKINQERARKRKYLSNYKILYDKVQYLAHEIQGLKSIDYSYVCTTNKGSMAEKIDDLNQLEKEMADIRSLIDAISDKRLQIVLSYRYLLFKNNDEIALIMNYSDSHIKRLINHALDKLEV